jgi:hypothetical protein
VRHCGPCGTTTGAMRRGRSPCAAVCKKNEGQVCHRQCSLLKFKKYATSQRIPKPETPNVICQKLPEAKNKEQAISCAHPGERNKFLKTHEPWPDGKRQWATPLQGPQPDRQDPSAALRYLYLCPSRPLAPTHHADPWLASCKFIVAAICRPTPRFRSLSAGVPLLFEPNPAQSRRPPSTHIRNPSLSLIFRRVPIFLFPFGG